LYRCAPAAVSSPARGGIAGIAGIAGGKKTTTSAATLAAVAVAEAEVGL
jgi:hypothetical protein